MRGQPGVGSPAARIVGVTGVGGRQQPQHLIDGGLLLAVAQLLPDDRLDQPVQLKGVVLAAGQRETDHHAQHVIQRIGVGRGGAQRLGQQLGVLIEQFQRDRLGARKAASCSSFTAGGLASCSCSSDNVQVVASRPS